MPNRWIRCVLSALLVTSAGFAQESAKAPVEKPALRFYRLDFTVKEVEGTKPVNSRLYSVIVSDEGPSERASIRAGDRVPSSSKAGEQQYIDVGVNIDIHNSHESVGELRFVLNADISSLLAESNGTALPLIRQTRWQSDVSVRLRKATQLFSADDAASKRQLQLEVTATPIESR